MRKLVLFLLLAAPCFANDSLAGFCEVGRGRVTTSGILSTNFVQASYPQCTVTVYLHGTTTLATLYSDNAGTPTPLANPFQAATNGYYQAYAVNGRYDVITSAGTPFSFAAPFTRSDVLLCDPYEAGSNCIGSGGSGANPLGTYVTADASNAPVNYQVLTAGTNITVTSDAGAHTITIDAAGGSGSPGGPQFAVQVNDPLASFGGSADFTWDDTAQRAVLGSGNSPTTGAGPNWFDFLVGDGNDVSASNGVNYILGQNNVVGANASGTIFGDNNISAASGNAATIVGSYNVNSGSSTVTSGTRNFNTGSDSYINGGERNSSSGNDTSINGGEQNIQFGHDATIFGGERNYVHTSTGDCVIGGEHLGAFAGDCYSLGENFTNSTNSSVMLGLTPFPGGVLTATLANAGTGYCLGDVLLVTGGNSDAIIQVTATDGSYIPNPSCGAATTIRIVNAGDGYTAGSGVATTYAGCAMQNTNAPPLTGGSCVNAQDGTLTVNITADTDATNKGPEIQVTAKAVKLPYSLTVQGVPVGGAGLASALPACDSTTEGGTRGVTDSTTATWGNTITGTGSNHVLAYCNGTNWTVAAK